MGVGIAVDNWNAWYGTTYTLQGTAPHSPGHGEVRVDNVRALAVDKMDRTFTNPRDKRTEDYVTGRFG